MENTKLCETLSAILDHLATIKCQISSIETALYKIDKAYTIAEAKTAPLKFSVLDKEDYD